MKNSFYGAILLFAAFTLVSMVRCLIFQHKLYKYLLEKHTEKWKDLTTVLGVGPGYANGLKAMKFLFSKDDLSDPEVLRLKVIVRNSFIHTFGGMITVFFTFCVMVWFCQKS